jgi:hypothetical protein
MRGTRQRALAETWAPGLVALAGLLAGCAGEPTGTVRGTVFYKDKPLPGGFVTFFSERGKAVTGRVEPDGTYEVPGVPVGPAKITVKDLAGGFGGGAPGLPAPQGAPAQHASAQSAVKIPIRFRSPDGSGLTYTVAVGKQRHDISLTD